MTKILSIFVNRLSFEFHKGERVSDHNLITLNDLEQTWMDRLETLDRQHGGLNMNPAPGQRTLLFISDSKLANYVTNGTSPRPQPRSHGDTMLTKRFPGKSIEEISKVAPSIIDREKPKRVILHVGSQDVGSDKPPKVIAKEIVAFAQRLRSASGYVFWISGLLPRDGLKNNKVFFNLVARTISLKFSPYYCLNALKILSELRMVVFFLNPYALKILNNIDSETKYCSNVKNIYHCRSFIVCRALRDLCLYCK